MTEEQILLSLFLLYASNPDFEKLDKELNEKAEREKRTQENCPNIEWEQDMGAHVPFCKLDGDFCNLQCINGKRSNASCCPFPGL